MFFIFLSLTILSYVHAQSVLIICNAGCGCVTETGVALNCSFVKSSKTTVIRAVKTPTGQFAPVRIIPIQFEDVAVQSDPSSQFSCPTEAGAAANGGYPMCNPIGSSSIPKTPVRVSEDVTEDLELEFVEHFVSSMENLSLVVTKQFRHPCSVMSRSRNLSVRYAKMQRFLSSCVVNSRNPGHRKPSPPPVKKNASNCRCFRSTS